jgi:hypothetical protein
MPDLNLANFKWTELVLMVIGSGKTNIEPERKDWEKEEVPLITEYLAKPDEVDSFLVPFFQFIWSNKNDWQTREEAGDDVTKNANSDTRIRSTEAQPIKRSLE